MGTILKRTLTRKSILGFGYSDQIDLSVQQMIDLGNAKRLISAYYHLEKIDFMPDILDEIGITEDIRIEKPSKVEFGHEFVSKAMRNYYEGMSEMKILGLKNKKKKIAKIYSNKHQKMNIESSNVLRLRNHGKL